MKVASSKKLFKLLLYLLLTVSLLNMSNFNFPQMEKGYDDFIKKSKYGEIYYFSKFYKSKLVDIKKGIQVNYYYKKDMKSLFFKKMRYGVAPLLIFPSEIKINNNYNYILKLSEFNYLKNLIFISEAFEDNAKLGRKKIVFNYLPLDNYKFITNQWGIFQYTQNSTVQIFLLPLDWSSKIKDKTIQ